MHKVKTKKIPIYRGILSIVITDNVDKFNKIGFNEVSSSEQIYAHALASTYKKDFFGYYIALNPSNKIRPLSYGCIAHEAFHISNMLLYDRGVFPDFNNDESQAYLIEWIVDETIKFLYANNIKIESKITEKV